MSFWVLLLKMVLGCYGPLSDSVCLRFYFTNLLITLVALVGCYTCYLNLAVVGKFIHSYLSIVFHIIQYVHEIQFKYCKSRGAARRTSCTLFLLCSHILLPAAVIFAHGDNKIKDNADLKIISNFEINQKHFLF